MEHQHLEQKKTEGDQKVSVRLQAILIIQNSKVREHYHDISMMASILARLPHGLRPMILNMGAQHRSRFALVMAELRRTWCHIIDPSPPRCDQCTHIGCFVCDDNKLSMCDMASCDNTWCNDCKKGCGYCEGVCVVKKLCWDCASDDICPTCDLYICSACATDNVIQVCDICETRCCLDCSHRHANTGDTHCGACHGILEDRPSYEQEYYNFSSKQYGINCMDAVKFRLWAAKTVLLAKKTKAIVAEVHFEYKLNEAREANDLLQDALQEKTEELRVTNETHAEMLATAEQNPNRDTQRPPHTWAETGPPGKRQKTQ